MRLISSTSEHDLAAATRPLHLKETDDLFGSTANRVIVTTKWHEPSRHLRKGWKPAGPRLAWYGSALLGSGLGSRQPDRHFAGCARTTSCG